MTLKSIIYLVGGLYIGTVISYTISVYFAWCRYTKAKLDNNRKRHFFNQ